MPFTKQNAINLLEKACKPSQQIGLEFESFLVDKTTLCPLGYSGEPHQASIKSILKGLAKTSKWKLITEKGLPIGAVENKSEGKLRNNITLEPGGQMEIALAPQPSVKKVAKELERCFSQIQAVARSQNAFCLNWGFAPWQRSQMAEVPKERYKIMRKIMPKVGTLGLDMMHRTSSVQVSLDFATPADMVLKFRTALLLQPFIITWFANSPSFTKGDGKFLSYRTHCWSKTDSQRAWFVEEVFNENFGFEEYVDFVFKVPMYFIKRNGKYIDLKAKVNFEEHAPKATIQDFEDHLSTIFTQARLKSYLEIRGCDGGSPQSAIVLATLLEALFYDPKVLAKAYEMLRAMINPNHLSKLSLQAAKHGFATRLSNGKSILDNSAAILELIKPQELMLKNNEGMPSLSQMISNGTTPAEALLKRLKLANNDWRVLLLEEAIK